MVRGWPFFKPEVINDSVGSQFLWKVMGDGHWEEFRINSAA